ncbi:hypothetical protein LDENG_00161990 [Lucifuga dentata]|nr:hypothetical protein LDENG_00161990 [Lucifuga dentata]
MASQKKNASRSSKASKAGNTKEHPCPSACGFFLSEADTHKACPVCLGMLHARAALANLESCAHCCRLRKSTLERRVLFLSKVLGNSAVGRDPLLSEAVEAPIEAGLEVMQEDPSEFTVPFEGSDLRVLCDDELSPAASGSYSEGYAEAGYEEEGEEQGSGPWRHGCPSRSRWFYPNPI